MKNKSLLTSVCGLLYVSTSVCADNSSMEVIEISSSKLTSQQKSMALAPSNNVADAADWLKSAAGAATNKNGVITGIAQYRGLFGDRIGVYIDNQTMVGAGPNAMDSPMSYAVPTNVESIKVYRGIAPVSVGINSYGGAIKIQHNQAQFANNSETEITGNLSVGYQSQGDGYFVSPMVNVANDKYAFFAFVNKQYADDQKSGNGTLISPTSYNRIQSGLDLAYTSGDAETHFNYKRTNTNPSGTPALPMDIDYIDTEQFNLNGHAKLNELAMVWHIGYSDATHGMDNYSLRSNMNPMMTRYNTAAATSLSANLAISTELKFGELTYGIDLLKSTHSAVITSPDNMMFKVVNFNDVEDDVVSAFSELKSELDSGQLTLGARIKQHSSDAGDVSHHMAMMSPAIGMLQDNFAEANNKQSDTLFDIALSYTQAINETINLLYAAGIKQKAPSYQERYLWIPMQATGGLADGHTYIGNPELSNETAYQINLGLEYKNETMLLSPQVYYQKIDDYIQALPSTNMQANMVASMMGGTRPMQFSNLDATLYGLDLIGHWQVTDALYLDAILSMVRGERDDVDEDLYRISADSIRIGLNYQLDNWLLQLSEHVVANQDRVSLINNEIASIGYATTDISARYSANKWSLQFGISNLFDRNYSSHLSGRYRPMVMSMGDDLKTGDKIPAQGRNLYLSTSLSF